MLCIVHTSKYFIPVIVKVCLSIDLKFLVIKQYVTKKPKHLTWKRLDSLHNHWLRAWLNKMVNILFTLFSLKRMLFSVEKHSTVSVLVFAVKIIVLFIVVAVRLYCPQYKTSACGCLQKYILAENSK